MKENYKNTMAALVRVQSYRNNAVYHELISLVESLRQDIRLANDTEPVTEQILRNQGGIHWLGELVKHMKADPERKKDFIEGKDGAYTDI